MKPLPSNQPFSSNDINYIVLLSLQHPAIKSNHGSLANLFTNEAAVSFPPAFTLHPLFLPCMSTMCALRDTLYSNPFTSGALHRATELPEMTPEILHAHGGTQTPTLGPSLSQFSRRTISGAQSGSVFQSWQKQHDLEDHLHHPWVNPGSCCWDTLSQCSTTWGFFILVLEPAAKSPCSVKQSWELLCLPWGSSGSIFTCVFSV